LSEHVLQVSTESLPAVLFYCATQTDRTDLLTRALLYVKGVSDKRLMIEKIKKSFKNKTTDFQVRRQGTTLIIGKGNWFAASGLRDSSVIPVVKSSKSNTLKRALR
jgi:hypothetical protein